ncbi:hypothetical protein, partial [Roseovarius sp. CH_XMU1461]|uniref:hypothetical protein n=1 Tax=Roseovarius sp. CH_XMU1461 TaxID=3107777 RepID=UPI003009EAF9
NALGSLVSYWSSLLNNTVKEVSIKLSYEVKDLAPLFEAAKVALERLRTQTVAEFGESADRLYAQHMDQLIQTELHDPASGELQPSLCIEVILDEAMSNVHGTELVGTASGPIV